MIIIVLKTTAVKKKLADLIKKLAEVSNADRQQRIDA